MALVSSRGSGGVPVLTLLLLLYSAGTVLQCGWWLFHASASTPCKLDNEVRWLGLGGGRWACRSGPGVLRQHVVACTHLHPTPPPRRGPGA